MTRKTLDRLSVITILVGAIAMWQAPFLRPAEVIDFDQEAFEANEPEVFLTEGVDVPALVQAAERVNGAVLQPGKFLLNLEVYETEARKVAVMAPNSQAAYHFLAALYVWRRAGVGAMSEVQKGVDQCKAGELQGYRPASMPRLGQVDSRWHLDLQE